MGDRQQSWRRRVPYFRDQPRVQNPSWRARSSCESPRFVEQRDGMVAPVADLLILVVGSSRPMMRAPTAGKRVSGMINVPHTAS